MGNVELREIRTYGLHKKLMADYYQNARMARERGIPLAWISATFPVEILYAMGIFPIYPENHSALCGARKVAVELSQAAEGMGYSMDLCSYARTDLGSIFSGQSPVGGLPRPDFLLVSNNQCDTIAKWYEVLARHFDSPMFLLDAPSIIDETADDGIKDYFIEQLKDLVEFLENRTAKKLDQERFRQVLELSRRATSLWRDVLNMGKHRPAPLSCFDAFVHMASIVTLRGTQEAVDYYTALKEEMEERVANGIGAIPEEKYRLYWDNIPIWMRLRSMANGLAGLGACLVAALYTNAWAYDLDPSSPMESMADNYLGTFLNQNMKFRGELIVKMVEEFQIDGFIMHSNRSCKPYSFGQHDIKEYITERTGIPGMIFEADQSDSRFFSEAQINTRLEAFIETLEAHKGKKGT